MPNPTPPNIPIYPISALYLYPQVNTSNVPVDPTRGCREWQMTDPIPAGKSPTSLVNFGYYTPDGDYGMFSISYGEAQSPPNIAPGSLDTGDAMTLEAGAYGIKAYPIPARPLLDTESVSNVALLGLRVSNSAFQPPVTPAAATDSQNIAAIRVGLNSLLVKEGLSII